MDKLKVLVVDDTSVYRKILTEAVESTGLGSVVHTASNGAIALEWLNQCEVDVVLMDAFMPEMNGIEALKVIKKEYPDVSVIMISTGGVNSAQTTIEALKLGALDFIVKPMDASPDKNIDKIKCQLQVLFAQIKVTKFSTPKAGKEVLNNAEPMKSDVNSSMQHYIQEIKNDLKKAAWNRADIVVIASSTGGPAALEKVLTKLPADFKVPILVVQHMPKEFTKVLAQVINGKCPLNVIEGSEGDRIKEGQAIIAPGGLHMVVETLSQTDKFIKLKDTPYVNGVRPAADILFHSVSQAYSGKNILAVVLTGMGSDGMLGVSEMKKSCNCYCITQSESTCVVYGMPRSVYEAGLSDEASDIDDIANRIYKVALGRR